MTSERLCVEHHCIVEIASESIGLERSKISYCLEETRIIQLKITLICAFSAMESFCTPNLARYSLAFFQNAMNLGESSETGVGMTARAERENRAT